MNKEKIGAIYIRVSTEEQKELSPDAQLKAIKEYAKNHNIQLDSNYIYRDIGISGRTVEKRPAFMEMITTAKTKPNSPFQVVLVHKLDRFARNRRDSIVYKTLLKKDCNIELISISEDFGDHEANIILEANLEAFAEYYSINLSKEVKKGMREKASRGGHQTRPAYGYKKENGKLIIDESKANIVKMIFNDFYNEVPLIQITRKLNLMGIKTNKGKDFELRFIEYILRNPTYKGYIIWTEGSKNSWKITDRLENAIMQKGEHEPIIDENFFDKIQNMIMLNKSKYKYVKNKSQQHWLRLLIKCSNCGKTLTTSNSGLQCIGYSHGVCSKSHYISKIKLERAIINQLKLDYKDPINIKFKPKTSLINDDDIIKKQINNLKEKLIRAKELYLDGIENKEEYKITKTQIENQIEELKNKKTTTKKEAVKEIKKEINAKNVANLLENDKIDMGYKYIIVHELIDYIIYSKEQNSIDIYYK